MVSRGKTGEIAESCGLCLKQVLALYFIYSFFVSVDDEWSF